MHSSNQMSGFKDRIKKIEDPRFQYYVDPETGMHIPRHLTRDQVGNQNVSSGTILGMSFILGMLCLLVARYLRMEVINVEPYFPRLRRPDPRADRADVGLCQRHDLRACDLTPLNTTKISEIAAQDDVLTRLSHVQSPFARQGDKNA